MDRPPQPYNKSAPFLAPIKERFRLGKAGSQKNTHHVVIDLKDSGITYHVGDSIAIFPTHDPHLVEKTLQSLKMKGDELVTSKDGNAQWPLSDFLKYKANITEISRKLLQEICQRQTDPLKKEHLQHLLHEENRDAFKQYQADHEVWQVLSEHPEVSWSAQEFSLLLLPLLPRFYSIASSQRVVGDEVHLTIASVEYESKHGHTRRGVCTHYLCTLAELQEPVIPLYIQPHHGFTVPQDPNHPIIMIGPGTGIAPFRAFMQERMVQNATGRNWLFFGEWTRSYDFLYEEFWTELQKEGKLRLDAAFSRDQEHKVYVQHKMLENATELFQWIQEGALVYVCGDAQRMAKDVDAALHQIIQQEGGMDESAAKQYMKQMRTDKRYLRDIY